MPLLSFVIFLTLMVCVCCEYTISFTSTPIAFANILKLSSTFSLSSLSVKERFIELYIPSLTPPIRVEKALVNHSISLSLLKVIYGTPLFSLIRVVSSLTILFKFFTICIIIFCLSFSAFKMCLNMLKYIKKLKS